MTIKTKKNISYLLLIVSLISLVSAVYAWFLAIGGSVNDIIITVGEVKAEIKLYEGIDFNKDGIIDRGLDTDGNGIIDENEENLEQFIQVTEYPHITQNLNIGSTMTYKMIIKNSGTIDNILKFFYQKNSLDIDNHSLAKVLSLQFFIKENDIYNAHSDKTLLYKNDYLEKIEIGYQPKILKASNFELYFKIKFEDLETLKVLNDAEFNNLDNLNSFLNQSFTLPQFIVRIEQFA